MSTPIMTWVQWIHLSSIESIVEVDYKGKGIPKEKHILIFEFYVQVREFGSETELGTG